MDLLSTYFDKCIVNTPNLGLRKVTVIQHFIAHNNNSGNGQYFPKSWFLKVTQFSKTDLTQITILSLTGLIPELKIKSTLQMEIMVL